MLSGCRHCYSSDLWCTTANSFQLWKPLSSLNVSNQDVRKHKHIPSKLQELLAPRYLLVFLTRSSLYFNICRQNNLIIPFCFRLPDSTFRGKRSGFISKSRHVAREWRVKPFFFFERSESYNPLTQLRFPEERTCDTTAKTSILVNYAYYYYYYYYYYSMAPLSVSSLGFFNNSPADISIPLLVPSILFRSAETRSPSCCCLTICVVVSPQVFCHGIFHPLLLFSVFGLCVGSTAIFFYLKTFHITVLTDLHYVLAAILSLFHRMTHSFFLPFSLQVSLVFLLMAESLSILRSHSLVLVRLVLYISSLSVLYDSHGFMTGGENSISCLVTKFSFVFLIPLGFVLWMLFLGNATCRLFQFPVFISFFI